MKFNRLFMGALASVALILGVVIYNHENSEAEIFREHFGNVAGYKTEYNGIPVQSSMYDNAVVQDIEAGYAVQNAYGSWTAPRWIRVDGKKRLTYTAMFEDIRQSIKDRWIDFGFGNTANNGWLKDFQELVEPFVAQGFDLNTRTTLIRDDGVYDNDSWQSRTLKSCQNKQNISLTMDLAGRGCVECLRWLIEEKNADPNVTDCNKRSLAHWAAESRHFLVIKYLLSLESFDKNLLNSRLWNQDDGITVLNYWKLGSLTEKKTYDPDEIREYLYSHGAMWGSEISQYYYCIGSSDKDPYYISPEETNRKYLEEKELLERFGKKMDKRFKRHLLKYAFFTSSCANAFRQLEYKCTKYKQRCFEMEQVKKSMISRGYDFNDWEVDKSDIRILMKD